MKKRKTKEEPAAPPRPRLTPTWWIVAATLLVVPVIFDVHGKDNFRLPKELALRLSGIALSVAFLFWVTRKNVNAVAALRHELRTREMMVAFAIVGWTALTTVTSLNRILSLDSLVTVITSAVFFLGCRFASRRRPLLLFSIALVGAIVNAIVTILQQYRLWQPFQPLPGANEIGTIGLLGNSNDVGSYLLGPAVAALVATVALAGRQRIFFGATSAILVIGLLASGARTAVAAYVVALAIAAITNRGRGRLVALFTVAAIAAIMLWPGYELGRRYWRIAESALTGELNVAAAERLPAFLTAVEMVRDRPLVGVGPGAYKWLYMRYRRDLVDSYPPEWVRGAPLNFAEVHNDHLQVAAETGVVGFLLLWTGIVSVAVSRRPADTGRHFAERLRLPVAVAAVVLMVAQFPLQLAAPRMVFLFLAAFSTSSAE